MGKSEAEYLRYQDDDGSWYPLGVNYNDVGSPRSARHRREHDQDWILRGAHWIESCQNDDGVGRNVRVVREPGFSRQGESTASQTSWRHGICACGKLDRPSVQVVLSTQRPDGAWTEPQITGTGFPRVFYLKYDVSAKFSAPRARDLISIIGRSDYPALVVSNLTS